MHLLEGEALMNDASGLVAFKFAIAAAMTGVFSLVDASLNFLLVAVGGLAIAGVPQLVAGPHPRLDDLPWLGPGDPRGTDAVAAVRLYMVAETRASPGFSRRWRPA